MTVRAKLKDLAPGTVFNAGPIDVRVLEHFADGRTLLIADTCIADRHFADQPFKTRPEKPAANPNDWRFSNLNREADLEFILESAYPSSQLSDAGVRVQSSPDPDGRLVRMVDKRDRRRQRANEAIGNLERQLQQITEVQNLVYTLDTRSKCVLLALYYPYRSYDEAAEFLQVERTTVYRQREIALNRLFARAERSKAFHE